MKRIATVVALAGACLSLSGCVLGPSDPANHMDDFLAQTNSWAQGMQANSQQMLQSTSAGMQQTQTANREWTQQNSDGTIVHCITVGVYTTCK